VHNSSDEVFCNFLKKQSIVQKKMIPLMKAKVIFIGKYKKKKNLKKNNLKWPTKKSSFPSSANSQYFLAKISWIGPLVGKID
jgi:hypothetical protein